MSPDQRNFLVFAFLFFGCVLSSEAGTVNLAPISSWELGVFRIPLILSPSLETRRVELEKLLEAAQRRLGNFARKCKLEHFLESSLIDRAEIFDRKEDFDKKLIQLDGMPPETKLPITFSGAVDKRVLYAVAPEIYRNNFPQGNEPDFYEKLLCHEMAHWFHVRVLGGNEEAMGPVWFYEGFAIIAADQLANSPSVNDKELWDVVANPKRGSYLKYAVIIRRFAALSPIVTLVYRANKTDFLEYLHLLLRMEEKKAR